MSPYVSSNRTKDFLDLVNDFLLISDLDTLQDEICKEVSSIIPGIHCSIFLIPEYVTEFTGQLLKGNETTLLASELKNEFIILAKTTNGELKDKIGKAFYQKGYGLIGWIFENGRPLQIDNIQDNNELKSIDENLEWIDEYKSINNKHTEEILGIPFLGVPLKINDTILGVISINYSHQDDSLPSNIQDILVTLACILSNLLEKVQLIKKQKETIEKLVKIGSTKNRREVFDSIVQEASNLVGAENCELYTLDKFGETIYLVASTREYYKEQVSELKRYKRGYGLTGWVFKTGKPLLIKNVKEFKKERILSDDDLEIISIGKEINAEDRKIQWADIKEKYKEKLATDLSYLGVPINSEIDEVLGVLRASSPILKASFDKKDMQLLQDFADNISLILHNEDQRELGDVLIEVGNILDTVLPNSPTSDLRFLINYSRKHRFH